MNKESTKPENIECHEEFEKQVQTGKVCIKFYSPSCPHCIALKDKVFDLFVENNNLEGMKFLEVNVSSPVFKEIMKIIEGVEIHTVPHTVLFIDGIPIIDIPGTDAKGIYDEFIKKISDTEKKNC